MWENFKISYFPSLSLSLSSSTRSSAYHIESNRIESNLPELESSRLQLFSSFFMCGTLSTRVSISSEVRRPFNDLTACGNPSKGCVFIEGKDAESSEKSKESVFNKESKQAKSSKKTHEHGDGAAAIRAPQPRQTAPVHRQTWRGGYHVQK